MQRPPDFLAGNPVQSFCQFFPAVVLAETLALPGAVFGKTGADDFRVVAAITSAGISHDQALYRLHVLEAVQFCVQFLQQVLDFCKFIAHDCYLEILGSE